jgi:hypothetical protein
MTSQTQTECLLQVLFCKVSRLAGLAAVEAQRRSQEATDSSSEKDYLKLSREESGGSLKEL